MPTSEWHIEVEFQEDDTHTNATVVLRLPDRELQARGHATRNPADKPQPRVGEEIATARALNDLTSQPLEQAANEISAVTHQPANIHG